jgi:hypothetical protein
MKGAFLGRPSSAKAGDEQLDQAAGVVAGVVAGAGAQAADAAHELVGVLAAADLAGGGRGVEQLGAHGLETFEEVRVQGVEARVVGLQHGGEDLTEVVLVGHSYAGLVISSVANEIPDRIGHLVYLDAMVPEDGETAADVMPMTQDLIDRALRSESGWRVPPFPAGPAGLFGVTDPADMAWLRTMLSDQPVRCLQQPARLDNPDVAKIPRTHIHCTAGAPVGRRPVPPIQPNGIPAQVWELPTGHDCMITMPAELAELFRKLG